jgi:hypothetical protein
VSAAEAKERAEEAAEIMVNQAAVLKQEAHKSLAQSSRSQVPLGPTVAPHEAPRMTARMLTQPTFQVAGNAAARPRRRPLRRLMNTALGPKARFLAGVVLIGLCLLWMEENPNLAATAKSLVSGTVSEGDVSRWGAFRAETARAKPLHLPLVPDAVLAPLFNSFLPGIAGLLLIVAALATDLRAVSMCLAGALVVLFGPLVPLPDLGIPADYVWAVIGGTVVVLGFVLGRFVR